MDPSRLPNGNSEVSMFYSDDAELVFGLRDHFRSLIEEFGNQVFREDLLIK